MTAAPQPLSPPYLEVELGDNTRRTAELTPGVTRLGRGDANDIQLPDGRVSKRHAEIRFGDDELLLVDTRSRAGVYVNGDRITERALTDGDVITFGQFRPPALTLRWTHGVPSRDALGSSALLSTFTIAGAGAAASNERANLEMLGRFLEFSRVFAGGVALAGVLGRVVDVAIEITGAERGILVLVRPDGKLDFEVAHTCDGKPAPRERLRVSETIVREVVATGKPRVISDIADEEGLAQAQSIVSLQLGSAAAIPLWRFALADTAERARSTDEVFGVLYLDSRARRDAFSRFDLGMLESLARDASSAIENARLLREAEDKRRMEREIQTAREVQAALLPESYWTDPHFDVAGSCVPCLDLGGDYLDQFRLPDGRAAFVVADVCGKGLPAALLAAAVQGAIASGFDGTEPLGAVVARVNRVVCRLAPTGDFISMLCCVLAPDGELTYVNAGHCPIIVGSRAGQRELATGNGAALGIVETAKYEVQSLQLQPGEVAVLYSDGVTEAANTDNELFGEDRIAAALGGFLDCDAAASAQRILQAVVDFRGDQPVADDMTLLVLKYLGTD